MVPFWFVGSKFLQMNYEMSVTEADSLMMLPEGMIVIMGPLIGLINDGCGLQLRGQLNLLTAACLLLSVGMIDYRDATFSL
jgi:hypothetical protein